MKQLLIVVAIVALVYVFFLSEPKKAEEKPEVIYQQQIEKAEQLEDSMQKALEQRMQSVQDSGNAE